MKHLLFLLLLAVVVGKDAQCQVDCKEYKTYLEKANNENNPHTALQYCIQARAALADCLEQYKIANQEIDALMNQLLIENTKQDTTLSARQQANIARQKEAEYKVKMLESEKNRQEALRIHNETLQKIQKQKIIQLARHLSIKALEIENVDIAGLLAKEAYEIHKDTTKVSYDTYIYGTLYSELKRLQERAGNKLFNTLDQKPVGITNIGIPSSVCISKDNKFIYTTDYEGYLLKWNLKAFSSKDRYKKENAPVILDKANYLCTSISISPNQEMLVRAGNSAGIEIFNLKHPKQKPQFIEAHNNHGITKLIFLPDNKTIISIGNDKFIYKSVLGETEGIKVNADSIPFLPLRMAISKDNRFLAVCGESHQILVYELRTGSIYFKLPNEDTTNSTTNKITAVAIDPSDRFVVAVYFNGEIIIWDLLSLDTPTKTEFHKARIHDLVFSQDGNKMAALGWDGIATLWEFEHKGEFPFKSMLFSPIRVEDESALPMSAAFTTDGSKLVVAYINTHLKIWETDMGGYADAICPLINKNLSNYTWRKYIGTDDYKNEQNLFIKSVDGRIRTPSQTCICNDKPCEQMPEK